MKKREYSLRDVSENISEEELKKMESIFNLQNSGKSEAIYVGRFVYLPDNKIKDPANLMIMTPRKNKIDHTAKLESIELQKQMQILIEKNTLLQEDTLKVVNTVRKLEKAISEDSQALERLVEYMEEYTNQIVKNKQIEGYVNKLYKNCDTLTQCLFLENPNVLPDEIIDEILNKVAVLRNNLDKLSEELAELLE